MAEDSISYGVDPATPVQDAYGVYNDKALRTGMDRTTGGAMIGAGAVIGGSWDQA